MDEEDELSKETLDQKVSELFEEIEGRKAVPMTMDDNTIGLIGKAIQRGYELGYEKFYTPMCDKCEYRSATCFGPGAYCDECSLEVLDEEE